MKAWQLALSWHSAITEFRWKYKNINNDEGIKKESKRDKSHSIFRTQANKNFFVKKGIKKNSGKFLIILDVEILFKGKTKDNQTIITFKDEISKLTIELTSANEVRKKQTINGEKEYRIKIINFLSIYKCLQTIVY